VVYRVGWPDQHVIRGTLADIRAKVKETKITRTALIFVGRVFENTGFSDSRASITPTTGTSCDEAEGRDERLLMLSGWSRDFRQVLAAFAVSSLGTKIAREAVPLTAVLVLQAGPGAMSLLGVAATLPTLLLGLFAGRARDRRRPPAVDDRGGSAALPGAGLGCRSRLGSACSPSCNCLAAVIVVAALSLLFQRRRHGLPAEPGRARTAGPRQCDPGIDRRGDRGDRPAIGGVLVQTVTAPLALLIDALSYLASALLPAAGASKANRRRKYRFAVQCCRTSPRACGPLESTDPAGRCSSPAPSVRSAAACWSVLCALCDQGISASRPR